MEDMRAAGLNPILSYQSGAPGGPSPSIGSMGSAGNITGDIISAFKAGPEVKEKEASAGQKTSATGVADAQTEKIKAETALVNAQIPAAKARSDWDIANPGAHSAAREAELRGQTGQHPLRQLIGGGLQRIEDVGTGIKQHFKDKQDRQDAYKYEMWMQQVDRIRQKNKNRNRKR